MSDEEGYKLTLKGPGLSVDREISKALADQLLLTLLTGHGPAAAAAPSGGGRPGHQGTPARQGGGAHHGDLSIREFLDDCAAKRGPDKITAIGVYLADHTQQTDFKRDDLVRQFENAAETVPKNLNRDIKWTAKAGWIAPRSGSTDTYYVTKTGREAVEAKFSKEVVQKTKGMTTYVPKKGNSQKASKNET